MIISQPIFLNADKNRISQVISTLLSNAVKFTKDNNGCSNIIAVVYAKRDENCVIVTVKDYGEGINTKIFPRLFSKFGTNSYQGIGLGLFISKKIIDPHGGKIWAENNSDGRQKEEDLPLHLLCLLLKIKNRQVTSSSSCSLQEYWRRVWNCICPKPFHHYKEYCGLRIKSYEKYLQ